MNGFWENLTAQRAYEVQAEAVRRHEARQADEFRQQQWERGFSQNPFTQQPASISAVAAEAYKGLVIEGAVCERATAP